MNGRHQRRPHLGQLVMDCRARPGRITSISGQYDDDIIVNGEFSCSWYACITPVPGEDIARYRRTYARALKRAMQRYRQRDKRVSELRAAYRARK